MSCEACGAARVNRNAKQNTTPPKRGRHAALRAIQGSTSPPTFTACSLHIIPQSAQQLPLYLRVHSLFNHRHSYPSPAPAFSHRPPGGLRSCNTGSPPSLPSLSDLISNAGRDQRHGLAKSCTFGPIALQVVTSRRQQLEAAPVNST